MIVQKYRDSTTAITLVSLSLNDEFAYFSHE